MHYFKLVELVVLRRHLTDHVLVVVFLVLDLNASPSKDLRRRLNHLLLEQFLWHLDLARIELIPFGESVC